MLPVLCGVIVWLVSGCPGPDERTGAAGQTSGNIAGASGRVAFSGTGEGELTVSDNSGKYVYSSDLPCETSLPPGDYIWSVRAADNQCTSWQPFTVMSGDSLRISVTVPQTATGEEGAGQATKPAATDADAADKPWVSTEPLVSTDKRFDGSPPKPVGASDESATAAPEKSPAAEPDADSGKAGASDREGDKSEK